MCVCLYVCSVDYILATDRQSCIKPVTLNSHSHSTHSRSRPSLKVAIIAYAA